MKQLKLSQADENQETTLEQEIMVEIEKTDALIEAIVTGKSSAHISQMLIELGLASTGIKTK